MRRVLARGFSVVLVLALLHPSGGFGVAAQVPDAPARVSVATDGTEGNGYSVDVALSSDGRYVAFVSYAANLVSGDTNSCPPEYPDYTGGCADIFVHDRATHETTRVSVPTDGIQANGHSLAPAISADGRYVAFVSYATNLTSGDTLNCPAAYPSPSGPCGSVFVHDRATHVTTRVSETSGGAADGHSLAPDISADGRYVVFASAASNLVAGDMNNVCDTNEDNVRTDNCPDIFLHDRSTHVTTRISTPPDGAQSDGPSRFPTIAGSGRFVVYMSEASNLVDDNTNPCSGCPKAYMYDQQTSETSLVAGNEDGTPLHYYRGMPRLSDDGRYVAFSAWAENNTGDVPFITDNIFLLDRQTGVTTRVSVASDGAHGDNASFTPTAVSADGRYVAFWSWATNLVSGDTNEAPDVFIHDLANHQTTRVSSAWDGGQGNGWSYDASLSSDGRYVAYVSEANNLTPCDHNQAADVFVHDRFPGLPTPPDPLPAADHQLYLPLVNQRC